MLERDFHGALLIVGWKLANASHGLYTDPVGRKESPSTSGEDWSSGSLRACGPLSASAGCNHLPWDTTGCWASNTSLV